MELINAEARHLQAYDVVAKLPNGLPAAGQVTSAYDEALIARQALAMPAFMKYDSTLQARLELRPGDWETLVNQNYLLTQYRGGIGGKIGWTVSSEATYVGLARRNGVTLIATVMHCTSLQEITSAEKLLNWGFAMNGKVQPVGELVPPLPAPAPVARQVHRAAKPKVAGLASAQPASGHGAAGYALAAVSVAAAALVLGGLIWNRRRSLAARRRPQLTAPGATWHDGRRPEPRGQSTRALALVAVTSVESPARDRPRNTGTGLILGRAPSRLLAGAARVPAASVAAVAAPLRAAASATPTTVNLPSASAATNMITTPRPVKKPSCSSADRAAPPTGVPGTGRPAQWPAIRSPTANQAPASAASQDPNTTSGLNRLSSTTRPHASVTAPGRTSSHHRPLVACQALSGVYA